MYTDMENWAEIRRRVLADGLSGRAARREYNIHWKTLRKILDNAEPPGYRRTKPARPSILEPLLPVVHQILQDDRKAPKKQRHTAQRIFDRLKAEHGYLGGLSIVKDAARAWRAGTAEVFVPLAHPPGEAQADFGHAEVVLDGRPMRVAVFVMIVGFARRNFLVPVPVARGDLEGLNTRLEADCRSDLDRRLRGKPATKAELLAQERAAMLPLPAEAFLAARVEQPGADSLSLVRFDTNDDSVPTGYAHRKLTAVGTVDTLRIVAEGRVVAEHRRCWDRARVFYDPVHYLALLERKPGALDFAAPLAGWELPVCFGVLRRRLEAELGGPGTRQFIRVLRLLERATPRGLTRAVERALELGVADADAVRLILEHRGEAPVGLFCLDGRPHLGRVAVPAPDLSAYASLAKGVPS